MRKPCGPAKPRRSVETISVSLNRSSEGVAQTRGDIVFSRRNRVVLDNFFMT
jgi:hypothetical protein